MRKSEEPYRIIAETAPDAIITIDEKSRIVFVNTAAEKIFGYSKAELAGRPLTVLMPEPFRKRHRDAVSRYIETGERSISWTGARFPGLRKDGREIPLEMSYGRFIKEGKIYFTGFVRDVSEQAKTEEQLRRANERLDSVLSTITDGYILLDREWRIKELNKQAAGFFMRPVRELTGKVLWDEYPEAVDSESYRQYHWAAAEGRPVHFETFSKIFKKWVEIHVYPRAGHLEIYFLDISERKKMEETIRHQASHDELTGLANRALFEDHFNLVGAEARRNGTKIALLFLDLDRFKVINDTLGHDAGDQLLREVAARLKECTRASDTVARIGGDEFNLLLADLNDAEDATRIVRKIRSAFQRPFVIRNLTLRITCSIGISIYPDDGQDGETLLKYADIAMYHVKEQGRDNYQFYSSTINTRSLERLRLETELQQAIEREELVLYYQPVKDIDTGRLICIEALLRWRHPEHGLLLPDQFIRIAEETGLLVPIGEWTVRTACRQNKEWQSAGYPPVCITVNLSGRQFRQPDLPERMLDILEEVQLDPRLLEFQITETTAMRDVPFTISSMKKLTEKGVKFSLDDFGIGCSSLSSLRKLPVHKLNIDRSFVTDIPHNADHRAIVRAVIALAHSLRLKTIAEGVENDEQLAFLRSNHCDEIQGYLVNQPLPVEKLRQVMAGCER